MNKHRFRCPECRTRRTSFMALIEHCQDHGHALCRCGGYHYAHRPNSPYCERNSMAPLRAAIRAGDCSDEELLDIQLDCAIFGKGRKMAEWPG